MVVGLLPQPLKKQEDKEAMVRSEHYYCLSADQSKILKFDVFISKMGVFYDIEPPYKIMMLTTS